MTDTKMVAINAGSYFPAGVRDIVANYTPPAFDYILLNNLFKETQTSIRDLMTADNEPALNEQGYNNLDFYINHGLKLSADDQKIIFNWKQEIASTNDKEKIQELYDELHAMIVNKFNDIPLVDDKDVISVILMVETEDWTDDDEGRKRKIKTIKKTEVYPVNKLYNYDAFASTMYLLVSDVDYSKRIWQINPNTIQFKDGILSMVANLFDIE